MAPTMWPRAGELQGLDGFTAGLAQAGALARALAGGPYLLARLGVLADLPRRRRLTNMGPRSWCWPVFSTCWPWWTAWSSERRNTHDAASHLDFPVGTADFRRYGDDRRSRHSRTGRRGSVYFSFVHTHGLRWQLADVLDPRLRTVGQVKLPRVGNPPRTIVDGPPVAADTSRIPGSAGSLAGR